MRLTSNIAGLVAILRTTLGHPIDLNKGRGVSLAWHQDAGPQDVGQKRVLISQQSKLGQHYR